MYFLVYSSTVADDVGEVELHDILTVAVKRNEELDVTGLLILNDGTFIQLLEGDADNVHEIYDSIKKDDRHFKVTTLYKGETDKRYFPDWRMAFEATLEKTFRQMKEYENLEEASDFLKNADYSHQGLRLLRYFYEIKKNRA